MTGHGANGTAVVVSDESAGHRLQRPSRPGVTLTNFWISDGTPAEYDGAEETCAGPFILHPPPAGSVFRLADAQGEVVQPLGVPNQPALSGLVLFAQWFQLDSGVPFVTSGVMAVVVGP